MHDEKAGQSHTLGCSYSAIFIPNTHKYPFHWNIIPTVICVSFQSSVHRRPHAFPYQAENFQTEWMRMWLFQVDFIIFSLSFSELSRQIRFYRFRGLPHQCHFLHRFQVTDRISSVLSARGMDYWVRDVIKYTALDAYLVRKTTSTTVGKRDTKIRTKRP